MSYEKYYPGGWQSGESGGTPITPEALNHMESGIANSAPAGYVDAFYTVSDFVELLTKVDTVLPATISRKEVRLAMSVTNWTDNIPSGEYLITVYNEAPGYALLTAKSNVAQFQNRLYNGEWGGWVDCSPSAFAPAGYVSGAYRLSGYASLDALLTEIYTPMADNSVKTVFIADDTAIDFKGGDLIATIYKNDPDYGVVEFTHYIYQGTEFRKCIYGGAWQPLEWVNPPMATGVEYRTAERFDGSPVYTKLVYFGNLPNNGAGNVAWSPDSGYTGYIIDARVIAGGNFINLEHSVNSSAIWIVTNADYSDTTAVVLLKYTKS